MLRKLLKYDFRSLYRPFVLVWAAALALLARRVYLQEKWKKS